MVNIPERVKSVCFKCQHPWSKHKTDFVDEIEYCTETGCYCVLELEDYVQRPVSRSS
jgi:hypothetical protein